MASLVAEHSVRRFVGDEPAAGVLPRRFLRRRGAKLVLPKLNNWDWLPPLMSPPCDSPVTSPTDDF